jgi:hypothetical protein
MLQHVSLGAANWRLVCTKTALSNQRQYISLVPKCKACGEIFPGKRKPRILIASTRQISHDWCGREKRASLTSDRGRLPLEESLTKVCNDPKMPLRAPISHHLDLYRYWLAKLDGRMAPARSDLDPVDFPALLPYMMLVEKVDDQFRYRLLGSALARQLGRDVTGNVVGSQFVNAPEAIAAKRAVYERVFATAQPVFITVEFKIKSGAIHNVAQLILPLAVNGTSVDMAVSTLVARFNFEVAASVDLKGIPVKVRDVIDIDSAAELEKLCLQWEQYCDNQWGLAERIAHFRPLPSV